MGRVELISGFRTPSERKSFYEENGYLIIDSGITELALGQVGREISTIFSKQEESAGYAKVKNRNRRSASELHLDSDTFAQFVQHECFLDICVELLGMDVDLRFASTITKTKSHGSFLDWHQDAAYGKDPDPYLERLTCWTAITEVTETNGCILVIPGSHKSGLLHHAESKLSPPDLRCTVLNESARVALPMAPGQVLILHPLIAHASGPNLSGADRIAMMVGYQKPKTIYRDIEIKWGYRFVRNGRKLWEKIRNPDA